MSLVTETVREKARARTESEKSPAMKTVRGGLVFRNDHKDDMVTETRSVASKVETLVYTLHYMTLGRNRGPVTRQVGHGRHERSQCREALSGSR